MLPERQRPIVGSRFHNHPGGLAKSCPEAPPLFWGLGNRNTGRRLTAQAVYNMLEKRTREAGVEALSPHDSRRNYVGE